MNEKFYALIIDKLEVIQRKDGTSSLMIWGWAMDNEAENNEIFSLLVNGEPVAFRVRRTPRSDVTQWYPAVSENPHPGFILRADLPFHNLESVSLQVNDREPKIFDQNYLEESKNETGLDYAFDFYHHNKGTISIGGWLFSTNSQKFKISILDAKGKTLTQAKIAMNKRMDVERAYFVKDERVTGFAISIPHAENVPEPLSLKIRSGKSEWIIPVEAPGQGAARFLKSLNVEKLKKGWRYLSTNGVRPLLSKLSFRIHNHPVDENEEYNKWFRAHRTSAEELAKQRETKFEKNPLISLIVAAYNTPIDLLEEMIQSVKDQTYGNWQLCIADGSTDTKVREYLQTHPDERISWCVLEKNLGISGNMNAAAELAKGDYIALYDHDDFLEPDCLYEVVSAINEKEYDFIYTDEDKFDEDTKRFVGPNFKPDFSPALLQSTNYICHFLAVRRDVYEKVGNTLRSKFDGAQDYDLVLRLMDECKTENIHHIPKILYHWRMHEGSTALDASSKLWAYEAGERALRDWLRRNKISGRVLKTGTPGHYHVRFNAMDKPLVSVIIPNKDHKDDLRICIDSFERRCKYPNYEMIVVENNSTEEATFREYEAIKKDYSNVRVITWDKPFNYSAINNFGVKHSNGKYLLFLNNDTETIDSILLDEMVGQMQQEDVGAVGAKLYYEDGTIQHNGIIIGHSGVAGHALIGHSDLSPNYRVRTTYDVMAATGACLMTSRKVFDEVHGFNEDLPVAYNDVDFCLRIIDRGYRIVQDPYAVMYHYESRTRGYEDSSEKKKRFENDVRKMYNLWPDVLRTEDPYYNRNLDITGITYGLRKDDEVNPYINPDFLKEAYYTAGSIRPERKKTDVKLAEHKESE